jgi:hypothetical protein
MAGVAKNHQYHHEFEGSNFQVLFGNCSHTYFGRPKKKFGILQPLRNMKLIFHIVRKHQRSLQESKSNIF